MRFLLDTDTCIYAIKRLGEVISRLEKLPPHDVGYSAVTLAELWFGAGKSSRPQHNRAAANAFLSPFEMLPFEARAAEAYAVIRVGLERAGQPIGERDLLIASIARARRLTVVTHNVREFARVAGIEVEDWV